MNAFTDSGESSCSRIIKPGDLDPVSHVLKDDATWEGVGPPGDVICQSEVLFVHLDENANITILTPKTHS